MSYKNFRKWRMGSADHPEEHRQYLAGGREHFTDRSGQDFYFSINDKMVNQFDGALLDWEEILLIVSPKEGVSAVFTFDDVVLQR